jgi:hypothetical protein
VGKHYCHQRVKDYGKSGNGSRPQMSARFCRFKSYQTGAATDDKLQEQGIVTGRRPEKQSAYQREKRGPFHDFCQHKNPFAGFTIIPKKFGETSDKKNGFQKNCLKFSRSERVRKDTCSL